MIQTLMIFAFFFFFYNIIIFLKIIILLYNFYKRFKIAFEYEVFKISNKDMDLKLCGDSNFLF